jgi:hypothetical protein
MVARYYSSSLARFMAVDPIAASAQPIAPQSWNRYPYVRNNPLGRIDPTGGADFSVVEDKRTPQQRAHDRFCGRGQCGIGHDFEGGTQEERDQAYKMQDDLRNSLTDEAKASYKANYGRNLEEDLTPGHGTTVNLTELRGKWGQYHGWTNDISIDRDAMKDPTLFGAALLHETGHFGADMATMWGWKNPSVDPFTHAIILEAVSRSPFTLFNYHFAEHDSGYAMEVWQYGSVVTLSR